MCHLTAAPVSPPTEQEEEAVQLQKQHSRNSSLANMMDHKTARVWKNKASI